MVLKRRSRASASERANERGVLAAVVAARRQELDLTQAELAELAGVARGSVVSVEAGRDTSLDLLLGLLHALGLRLEVARGVNEGGVAAEASLASHLGLVDENHRATSD